MDRREFLKAPALGMLVPGVMALEKIVPAQQKNVTPPSATHQETAAFEQRLHQDFSTYTPGIEYFLLGNGDIQAAIQYCPDRSGDRPLSFLGLTIMDAERFSRKWSTFLFHPERGFERTAIGVGLDDAAFSVAPGTCKSVQWKYPDGVPVVAVSWSAGDCEVEEQFYVPHEGSLLFRAVRLKNNGTRERTAKVWLSLVPNFALFDDIAPDTQADTVHAHGFADMKLQCVDGKASVSGRYEMNVDLGQIKPDHAVTAKPIPPDRKRRRGIVRMITSRRLIKAQADPSASGHESLTLTSGGATARSGA